MRRRECWRRGDVGEARLELVHRTQRERDRVGWQSGHERGGGPEGSGASHVERGD